MRRYKRTITTPSSKLIANGSLWCHPGVFMPRKMHYVSLKVIFTKWGILKKYMLCIYLKQNQT